MVMLGINYTTLAQPQSNSIDYSVLCFRVNLKKVKSYEIIVGDKTVYTATRNGHIKFFVYGDPYINLKVIETSEDGGQRTVESRIRLKRYKNRYNRTLNTYYWRIKRKKDLDSWTLGNYAIVGSKYLTRINVYNENGRMFFDRFNRENIEDNNKITKYDFSIQNDVFRQIKHLNSKDDDFFPMVNPSATKLYFTSQRDSRFGRANKGDIYTVNINEGSFGSVQLMPEPLNSVDSEGTSSFTGDGRTLVFTRCGTPDGYGNCDLYTASMNGEIWEQPQNMGSAINSSAWDSQPSISADGSALVFSSARANGYGKEDLYISHKNEEGIWSTPKNLGAVINTPSYEKSPFLAADGRTLYFSSSGHGGYGGMDMFKSVLIDGEWSLPVNMGNSINTQYDDLFFTTSASGDYAFFASKRPGGKGGFDIYQFGLPDNLKPSASTVVQGVVWDNEQNPLAANIVVQDLNTGDYIASTKSHPTTGRYTITLPSGRNYSVITSAEGRFFNSQNFKLKTQSAYNTVNRNITLEEIKIGAKARLNNIFFDTGKSNLTLESRIDLNRVVKLLEDNPTMIIQIGGHTDNVGNEASNLLLSRKRATAVKQYLIDAGIASDRLDARGFGESDPFTTNLTEEGRSLNRRTEFLILDY